MFYVNLISFVLIIIRKRLAFHDKHSLKYIVEALEAAKVPNK